MHTTEIVSLILGAVGTALGISNTWKTWSRDRIRLKLNSGYHCDAHGEKQLFVSVSNLGFCPVELQRVGYVMKRQGSMERFAFTPMLGESKTLPLRLEPFAEVTAYFRKDQQPPVDKIQCPYAELAGGRLVK